MATIKVLDKKGSIREHKVTEEVETIYIYLTGEKDIRGLTPHFLLLTDAITKEPIIIQSRYIYYVE